MKKVRWVAKSNTIEVPSKRLKKLQLISCSRRMLRLLPELRGGPCHGLGPPIDCCSSGTTTNTHPKN